MLKTHLRKCIKAYCQSSSIVVLKAVSSLSTCIWYIGYRTLYFPWGNRGGRVWKCQMRNQSPNQAMLPCKIWGWQLVILILLPDRKLRIRSKRLDVEMLKYKNFQKLYFALAGKLKLVFNMGEKIMKIVCHFCWHFPKISGRLLSQINSEYIPNLIFLLWGCFTHFLKFQVRNSLLKCFIFTVIFFLNLKPADVTSM